MHSFDEELALKEYDCLKQEILHNQDFVGAVVNYGLTFSAGFLAVLNSDAFAKPENAAFSFIGYLTIIIITFFFVSLIMRKLYSTYLIGTYIRVAIEPPTRVNWETTYHAYRTRDWPPNDALTRVKDFFTLGRTVVLPFIAIQFLCVGRLAFGTEIAWHWKGCVGLLGVVVILYEIYLLWTLRKGADSSRMSALVKELRSTIEDEKMRRLHEGG
jgi:hypothetical protein